MKLYGIDVSKHNGNLDYKKIKSSGVQFAMVRAGYGNGNLDSKFKRNMEGFINADVEVGAYWFLYSLDVQDAIREADTFNAALEPYKGKIAFPVACDFEYDSENYMRKKGVTPSKRLNTDIVKAFCERMQQYGWYVVNYANVDYINNHFYNGELNSWDLWLARWKVAKAGYACDIWQYTSDGAVAGSSTRTDLNYCYKDYPNIIKATGLNGYTDKEPKPSKTVEELAKEVLAGKWGNGSERKEKLTVAGYDYNAVQKRVNQVCSQPPKKTVEELAKEVLAGKWGNGGKRKKKLTAAGYDYNAVQKCVNQVCK